MKILKSIHLSPLDREFIQQWEVGRPDFTHEHVIYIIEDGVGYLSGSYLFGDLEIHQVFVVENQRRQGWGQAMIKTAQTLPELQRIILEVRASNYPAISLYQQADFREIHRRTAYYDKPKEDAIIMEWRKDDGQITHTSD